MENRITKEKKVMKIPVSYVNKHRGNIKLFVNEVEITSRTYWYVKERKEIMKQWEEAFKNMWYCNQVYVVISLYEFTRDPEKKAEKMRQYRAAKKLQKQAA